MSVGAAERAVDEPAGPGPRGRPPAAAGRTARRHGPLLGPWPVLAVVSLGGAIGASARYGAALLWPTAPDGFPWTTLLVNAVGCAVIGVFMVVISEVWTAHRLVRPFFGTGVLGGFTTFSTYAVDIQRLVDRGHAPVGLAYLGLTLLAALAAVWSAVWVTRRAVAWRQS
ncbi:fluoride efflux transporter FluC [Streptomyces sp. NBC_00859]|uniref:fluoride efflux transporter FluC n=1 Tax=Streptomyces sp. NBC_00859 TaxID=2903682 RepID=UPI0038635A3D|nr:CrcB family protein [Streptomyces sp. NBC_00859]